MAQKVTVALEDDLTGGPADETVRFGFDGLSLAGNLSSATCLRRKTRASPGLIQNGLR